MIFPLVAGALLLGAIAGGNKTKRDKTVSYGEGDQVFISVENVSLTPEEFRQVAGAWGNLEATDALESVGDSILWTFTAVGNASAFPGQLITIPNTTKKIRVRDVRVLSEAS